MKKKLLLFYLLFPVYFFVYATTPILSTGEYGKKGAQAGLELKLFTVDHLLSNITNHKHKESKSIIKVLMKRKRATVSTSESDFLRMANDNTGIVSYEVPDIASPELRRYALPDQDIRLKLHQDFQQAHSGLSPPIV